MRLWLLRPREGFTDKNLSVESPWSPWYDKVFGFVVRAETEAEARAVASEEGGDENREVSGARYPWIDPHYSTCEPLTDEGEPGLVIRDFAAA